MEDVNKALNQRNSIEALDQLTHFIEETHSLRTDGQRDLVDISQIGTEVLDNLRRLREVRGLSGIPTNWPYLDKATQGLQNGDLIVFVARPGIGKTTTMIKMAMEAFKEGRIPLFITMEMKRLQIGNRLMAMMVGANMTPLQRGNMTTRVERVIEQTITSISEEGRPFYFIEGQFRKHVGEVASLVHSLKPDIVFVDGAYLLKLQNANARMALHERIGEIAQTLKNIAAVNNIPVVASFQITREGGKKDKTGKDVGVEHIQLSDSIGQLASLVVGIFEDDVEETPEARTTRRMKILKGREGETGNFYINYNFETMDFSERIDPLEDVEEETDVDYEMPEEQPDDE